MGKRTTPWNKIKAEYLQGVTPKDLALKYDVSSKTIGEKASKEGWVAEKANICKNVQKNIQERIQSLTNLALETLKDVINDPLSENSTKVQASKAILDVSGLKSSKTEVTGKMEVQKVFITEKEHKEVEKHIDDVINE